MVRVNFFEDHLQTLIHGPPSTCSGPISFTLEFIIIIGCCVLGLIWAIINMCLVKRINV